MLAVPCSSFSAARDRTAVIRTKLCPWGLPKETLQPEDRENLQLAMPALVPPCKLPLLVPSTTCF